MLSVTSYSEVASSYIPQKVRKFMESDDCTPEEYKRLENEHLGDLFKMHFWRVVLDEAHAIKDSKTQCRSLLSGLRSQLIPSSIQGLSRTQGHASVVSHGNTSSKQNRGFVMHKSHCMVQC